MGIARIPQERQWTQPNTSPLFGNIFATKNIDFSYPGFLSLAPRTSYLIQDAVTGADFGQVISIVYGNFGGTTASGPNGEGYYVVTDTGFWLFAPDLSSFGELTNSTPPTPILFNTDAVAWDSGLWVSSVGRINNLTGGTWTNSLGGLMSASFPHPLCVAFNNLLLIGNGEEVRGRDTGGTDFTDLVVLPDEYRIQWMRSFNKNVWIGTRNMNNGNAKVYQWDGSSENFNNEYEVDTPWIYSGVSWNGNLYIVTSDGRFMAFNGAGFSEVGRLPAYTDTIATNKYQWGSSLNLGSIFQRGLAMVDGLPHISLNARAVDNNIVEAATSKFSSGVWVFDPNIGFYHKYSASNSQNETEFGSMSVYQYAGALSPVLLNPATSSVPDSDEASTLLWGSGIVGADNTNYYVLNTAANGLNRGYFQTTRVESAEVQDAWKYVWLMYEKMFDASDEIIVRYRTTDRDGLPFTTSSNVTYTSSTVFTSTDTRFANVIAGDNVVIVSGNGAGSVANITSISENAGTYTVTLDEAITNVSALDVGLVAVSNFSKIPETISIANIDGVNVRERYAKLTLPFGLGSTNQDYPSEWLELLIEIRGGDGKPMRLSNLAVLSEEHTKIIF